jgi:hypothetical protein
MIYDFRTNQHFTLMTNPFKRLGHANKSITDVYSKLKGDVAFRK